MSPEKRSAVMARIRGKNTKPELAIAEVLGDLGFSWESHASDLPGRPDFVFRKERLALFVDGDFWHGWRFSVWKDKLAANRARDARNFRKLRRMGWRVIRVWEHQIQRDLAGVQSRIHDMLRQPLTLHGDGKR